MSTGVPKQLIIISAGVALLVGVVASLATGSWWLLLAAMLVHGLASALVVGVTMRAASQDVDKPDPVTQARREEQRGTTTDEPSADPRR
jgi:membrane protein implicated in regulation of membrane protease activity